MLQTSSMDSIDYLAVGHITRDLISDGQRIGGSVVYAALTARALGLRAGIVTSWGEDVEEARIEDIGIVNIKSDRSTTFQNIETETGRVQKVFHVASSLEYKHIPPGWRSSSIVHLAPVANEINPSMVRYFPNALVGITPQGWFRRWDESGNVSTGSWEDALHLLEHAGATVISVEDVAGEELMIEELATVCRVLAVTEGDKGVRLYWNGDVRRFRPPPVRVVDTTGAGDIFAAAFFARLYSTRDPWEAARFATQLSAFSVTRVGLNSIPTQKEIEESLVEIY